MSPSRLRIAAAAMLLVLAAGRRAAAADGVLDPSFNVSGGAVISAGSWSRAFAVVAQPDGKVLIAGQAEVPLPTDSFNTAFVVARRNANGTADTTFGPSQNGTVTIDFDLGSPGFRHDRASSIAVGSGGRILVCGTALTGNGDQRIAVAQLTPSGLLDFSFGGGDGKVTHTAGTSGGYTTSCSLLLRPDFKILLSPTNTSDENRLLRLEWNGDLDASFDSDGRSEACTGCGSLIETVRTFDGKLLTLATDHDVLTLARYLDSGDLDPSFGNGGIASFAPPGANPWPATGLDMALDPSGMVVVLAANTVWFPHAALVRFRDGFLDPTFGNGGWVELDVPSAGLELEAVTAAAVMVQSDGKPVVVGSSDVNGTLDFVATRRTARGALDATFGGGWVTVAFDVAGVRADSGRAVAASGGRILIAGSASAGPLWHLAVARLQNALVWNDGFESGTTSLWQTPLAD